MEKEIALIDREGNKLVASLSIDWEKKEINIIHDERYAVQEDNIDVVIGGYRQKCVKGVGDET